jgi:hypothetical protein
MKKSSCTVAAVGVSHRLHFFMPIVFAALIGGFGAGLARAQGTGQDELQSGPTASDQAMADEATVVYRHAKPANTPAGQSAKLRDITTGGTTAGAATGATTVVDNDYLRFPADLTNNRGTVVRVAQMHAIFLVPKNNARCTGPACWGNPENFLNDLNISEFIHLADQYVGATANNRYPVAPHHLISYTPTLKTAPLTDANIIGYVTQVARATGQTGYGHIYHVFLPPGQDECIALGGPCYSPDVPKTFVFCGYHGSFNLSITQHVLYTVEPFQDVPGCSVRPGTPNGQVTDSTDNTLSHETFETITDPDGSAWFNTRAIALAGAEIGDECSFFIAPTPTTAFFDPTVSPIGNHTYAVQPEYTNSEHSCGSNP